MDMTIEPIKEVGISREKVYALEREIQKLPQVDCPIRNYFAPGMYAREMTIPAGVVVTGAVHRHEHLCTVSKGRLMVSTDEGMKEVSAPCTLVSAAGTKRVGYALEETVWTTYHVTNKTDLDDIMEEITESTNAELLGGSENVQLQMNRIQSNRSDYESFLIEYGLTQEFVTKLVEYEGDQIPMPDCVDYIRISDSKIHGVGMFATKDINKGEFVAPVRWGGKRTPAGRYINHSENPNIMFVDIGNGNLVAEALLEIKSGDEIIVDYRQAMSVNGAGFIPMGDRL